jgi:hypothetical protein
MDVLKRLGLLAAQCVTKEHDAASRADRLRDQVDSLTLAADLFRDDPQVLESAKGMVSDEYKRLKALAAKEYAEARRWATRCSYTIGVMPLLAPDELSARNLYPPDLQDAAIAAGVAGITSERTGRLGHNLHSSVRGPLSRRIDTRRRLPPVVRATCPRFACPSDHCRRFPCLRTTTHSPSRSWSTT